MNKKKYKIGVLTSSRADYGIYKSLLDVLKKDHRFDLTLIVFGMHLLKNHGETINEIIRDDYDKIDTVEGLSIEDSAEDITNSYGRIIMNFSSYWALNKFDLVFALGDRFEMSAAVQSSIPFGIDIAHLHGGEDTLGAIDNIYRYQISLASKLHFTAAEAFSKNLRNKITDSDNIHTVGSLSLDSIKKLNLPEWSQVCTQFNIPNKPFVLVTFHPETIALSKNKKFVAEVEKSLTVLCQNTHVVITLANADTMGKLYRDIAQKLKVMFPNNITLVNSFGKLNYFSAMKNCEYLLGNTSSGIIEAASFKKFVVNVGDRQKGRLQNNNVFNVPFNAEKIIHACEGLMKKGGYNSFNQYGLNGTADKILEILIKYFNSL